MRAFFKPNRNQIANRAGFTLLEALVGLMVFSIGILGILKLQAVAINSNTMARTSSDNTNIGVSAIERLYALNWDEEAAQPSGGEHCSDEDGSQLCWTITESPSAGVIAMVDDAMKPSVRLITIRASFVDQGGTQRTTILRLIKPKK
jgi:type II secretory pathway pseudopilin PulG